MKLSKSSLTVAVVLTTVFNAFWIAPAAAWPEEGRAKLVPTLADLEPGQSTQFRAILLPGRMQASRPIVEAVWSVDGIAGGDDRVGHIDARGLYRAPAVAPVPAEVHISVAVPEAPNKVLFGTVRFAGGVRYRVESQWPVDAFKSAGLKMPLRILLDSTDHVLISQAPMGSVFQFTKDGRYVGPFGKNKDGKTPGEICMLALSPGGMVYTGDVITGPPRINGYDASGAWQCGFAPKGAQPGMVVQPAGLAFHADGRFYLADMDGMRVSIFGPDRKFLGYLRDSAPEGDRTNFPSDVAFDDAGDLFVASAFGPCEKVNPETGERVMAFAYPLPPDGMRFVDDICLDRWNNVFLAVRSGGDPVQSGPFQGGVASIMKYNNAGDLLCEIRLGVADPAWVAIDIDKDDRIYAAYSKEATQAPEGSDESNENASAAAAKPLENGPTGGVEVLVLE